jgi:ribonuclease P/MRP protein subunit POP5
MVRLKTRYLLFEILYPDELSDVELESKASVERALRSPTLPNVDARKLLKLFKQSIEVNFGDLGLGYVSSTIASR